MVIVSELAVTLGINERAAAHYAGLISAAEAGWNPIIDFLALMMVTMLFSFYFGYAQEKKDEKRRR